MYEHNYKIYQNPLTGITSHKSPQGMKEFLL